MIFWLFVVLLVVGITLMCIGTVGNDGMSFDVGKYELMADIEAWNTDLAYWKEIQRNFWVGIFIPDIYDEFEYIELK